MNGEPTFERSLRGWLEAGPTQAPDRTVERALLTITNTQQERVRWGPWRKPRMIGFIRAAAVAGLALAVISVPILTQHQTGPAAATPPLPPTACPSGTVLASGDIATIAGTGVVGYSGDDGQATEAMIRTWDDTSGFHGDLVVGPDGALYFVDPPDAAIRRIGTDGVITTLAAASTGAPFVQPGGLAYDAAGDMLIADPGAARIWKLDRSGAITSVAGTGISGSSGDEGPATDAQVNAGRITMGPAGDLFLDDVYRVRRIDPSGVIHAFAGTGISGYSGDGGQAIHALFGDSVAVGAVAPDGTAYLADPSNLRIRRVDPSGVVTTIVGTGSSSFTPDPGRAVDATLTGSPFSMVLTADGGLYFSEWQRNAVRLVDSDGNITTIAGSAFSAAGSLGDCGPADQAYLNGPQGLAYRDGALFVADGLNNRIRMVVP